MDTTTSTVSPPAPSEHSASRAAHALGGNSLAICVWCGLILGALLIGWIGARAARSKAMLSPTGSVVEPETVFPVEASGARHELMIMLSQTMSVDGLDSIGDQLDDPQWDAQGKRVPDEPERRDVPESQRWQINFPSGTTEAEYARQLAALGVELGVVRSDGTVEYLSNPGEVDPKRRTGPRADEKRIYWTWRRGNLAKADKTLLKNAGIDAGEDIILHLWPPATADKLAKLEQEYKGRKPLDIFLTRFAVKRTFRGYEVYVDEQVGR
jgi:hypothetical protein